MRNLKAPDVRYNPGIKPSHTTPEPDWTKGQRLIWDGKQLVAIWGIQK